MLLADFFSVAENNAKRTNAGKVIECRAHATSKKEPVDGTPKVEELFFLHFFHVLFDVKRLKKKVRVEVRRGLGAKLPGLHGISLGLYILLTMVVFMHGVHIWGLNLHHARSIKNQFPRLVGCYKSPRDVIYGRHW
jgi:hypothetical protein